MITLLVSTLFICTACPSDDDDPKPNVEEPTSGNQNKDVDPRSAIDISYNPTQSSLEKEWAGQYIGWDAVQEANTTIRRKLVLSPNGNYTNVISGQLKKEGNNKFFKFESEAGTWTYNQSSRTVTYTCRYDSVLNYRDQTYTVYDKKHYYDHQDATYTEKADFSSNDKGKRLWITVDTYLQSLTAQKLDIAFSMSEYAGEKESDQNKEQK